MADVTGYIGAEQVELNNAATEVTLRALLASVNRLNQSVVRPPSSSGSGAAGTANAAMQQFGTTMGSTNKLMFGVGAAFGALSLTVGLLTGAISGVIKGATVVLGAFTDLGGKLLDGTARMSDFYNAVGQVASSIPILGSVLGPLAGIFEKIAQFQEKNMDVYQKLTDSGINFGGSLTQLRQAALDSYMSFDEFANLMKTQAPTLAMMGGGANAGAKAFAQLSKSLIENNQHLLSLGFTTAQVSAGMLNFIGMTGGRTSKELANTQAITAATTEYLEQLDGISRLTGESREKQEQEMAAAAKNAAFQAAMQGMTESERAKAMAGMANAMAIGGKGAVDAFQSKLMGIAPDQAGAMFIATAANAAGVIDQSANMVRDGSKTVKDMSGTMRDGMRSAQQDFAKYGKEGLFAIIRAGGPTADALQQLGITANLARNQTDEQISAALDSAAQKQSEAKAIADAEKALKDLGQNLMQGLSPIISALTPILGDVVKQFTAWVNTIDMGAVGKQIVSFANTIAEYAKNLFSEAGRNKIINDISYYFQLVLIDVKTYINKQLSLFTKDSTWDARAAEEKRKLTAEKALADAAAAAAQPKSKTEAPSSSLTSSKPATTAAIPELGTTSATRSTAGLPVPTAAYPTSATSPIVNNSAVIPNYATMNPLANIDVLNSKLDSMNRMTSEMLRYLRETAENTKRTVDATKSLSGNLFPTV